MARILALIFLIVTLSTAARSQERGSQAEFKLLYGQPDQAILDAQAREATIHNLRVAKATSQKDRQLIDVTVARLNSSEGGTRYHFSEGLDDAGVGSVFRLRPYDFVDQSAGNTTSVKPSASIISIIDANNAIVEFRTASRSDIDNPSRQLWLRGVDLSGRADRDLVPLDGFFVIRGSEKYLAFSGRVQTLLCVEPLDTTAGLQEIQKQASDRAEQLRMYKQKRAEDAAAKREASIRKWTSSNGSHTVEALLATYFNGFVTLEMRDGKKIKVEVTKLSDADQKYIDDWRREKR
jgi:SLA1 homology domain 1, SHD1